MLLDTMSMPADVELAHRRLCDFIWSMDELPQNENEFLRSHCRVAEAHWGRVKQGLMKKGWFELNNHLVHRGVVSSLNEAKEEYVAKFNQTARGRNSAKLRCVADPVTLIIRIEEEQPGINDLPAPSTDAGDNFDGHNARPVTNAVTTPVTHAVTSDQSESKSELELGKQVSTSSNKSKHAGARTKLTMMQMPGLDRIAREILVNAKEWCWETCRVKAGDITSASLQTVLKPFVGHVTEKEVHIAWAEAVRRADGAAKDNMARDPNAYCVTCFKEQLEKIARGGK